jgi:serine/threonine-protein phosphatase 6 regulatory ankyrin repeat subunit B
VPSLFTRLTHWAVGFAVALLVVGLAAPFARAGAIHDAADAGDIEQVRAILSVSPAMLHDLDQYGATPLHYASARNRIEVANLLLDNGAVLEARDQLGMTALHLAVVGATGQVIDEAAGETSDWVVRIELENVEVVDLLLARGASMDARDANNLTPLHVAAEKARGEIAGRLITRGADLEARDVYGFTPLMVAAFYMRIQWVEQRGARFKFIQGDNIDVAQLMVAAGADVNTRDGEGASALYLAAVEGHDAVVRLLLDHGADVNQPDVMGLTPLHAAADGARLLEIVAEGEEQGYSYIENTAIVTMLLDAGALTNARDTEGRTPLGIAQDRASDKVVALLRERGGTE